jgi:sugar-specific transcriptional regulator TrmB
MSKVLIGLKTADMVMETFGKVLDLIEAAKIESKEKRNLKLELMVLKEQIDQLRQELRRKDGQLFECEKKAEKLEKRIESLIMGVL